MILVLPRFLFRVVSLEVVQIVKAMSSCLRKEARDEEGLLCLVPTPNRVDSDVSVVSSSLL